MHKLSKDDFFFALVLYLSSSELQKHQGLFYHSRSPGFRESTRLFKYKPRLTSAVLKLLTGNMHPNVLFLL